MSIIEIRDLTFTYPGASEPTLKNASAVIEKGDFLAIVGNNGCGKSTLCKTLNGLIPHFIVGDMDGEVLIDGMNTKEQEIGTLARQGQDMYTRILRTRSSVRRCLKMHLMHVSITPCRIMKRKGRTR